MIRKTNVYKVTCNVMVAAMCLCYLFPIYLILTNSFKSRSEMYENMVALPQKFSFQYYASALEKMNFMISLRNSILLTVISIGAIVILTSMTAWMFVRSNNTLSKIFFNILVATMLIPFQTIMMPLMQEMNWINRTFHIRMTDSIPGLIFMYIGFGAGMGVFLYHGFVSSIPVSLEEAAIIDGCSTFSVFWRIVFPVLKPTTM